MDKQTICVLAVIGLQILPYLLPAYWPYYIYRIQNLISKIRKK